MSHRPGAPRARLLLTGDELLRGFVQDANSGFLAGQLRELGFELDQVRVIRDDAGTIEQEVRAARELSGVDLVIVSGGLGPTHDDRTTEAIAAATGRGTELREDALAVVEARVRAYGRMGTEEEAALFAPGNRKQATLPTGASWVEPLGTAPGYVVGDDDGRAVAVLPGPPSELRHAWLGIVRTQPLQALVARVGQRHERLLRLWAVPESVASAALGELGHVDEEACRITICARDGELELSLRGSDAALVDERTDELAGRFPQQAFAVDDHRPVVELVAAGLEGRGWSLALCESCTGGMLGSLLTGAAGASSWFLGALVTYHDDAKQALAGVAPDLLREHGAVSEQVARALAAGARAAFGSDVGIGITGIAGPGGGSADKPVGTVHVAVAAPLGERHRHLRIPGDRDTVRRRSCVIALHELRQLLQPG